MTRQTGSPLLRLPLDASNRQGRWLVRQVTDGDIDINPPYQRGAVWSQDQQIALMWSLLSGVPVPTIIINDRHGDWWTDREHYDPDGPTGRASYAVIDGKQRLTALMAWFDGRLAIPASWIPAEEVAEVEDTDDGPYVRSTGLTMLGRRMTGERILLPVAEAAVESVKAEAAIYLLVNGGGTPQTAEDMDRAAGVAAGS